MRSAIVFRGIIALLFVLEVSGRSRWDQESRYKFNRYSYVNSRTLPDYWSPIVQKVLSDNKEILDTSQANAAFNALKLSHTEMVHTRKFMDGLTNQTMVLCKVKTACKNLPTESKLLY